MRQLSKWARITPVSPKIWAMLRKIKFSHLSTQLSRFKSWLKLTILTWHRLRSSPSRLRLSTLPWTGTSAWELSPRTRSCRMSVRSLRNRLIQTCWCAIASSSPRRSPVTATSDKLRSLQKPGTEKCAQIYKAKSRSTTTRHSIKISEMFTANFRVLKKRRPVKRCRWCQQLLRGWV